MFDLYLNLFKIPSKSSLYTDNGGNADLAEDITCPASVPINSAPYDFIPSYIFLASPKLNNETASPAVSLVEKEFSNTDADPGGVPKNDVELVELILEPFSLTGLSSIFFIFACFPVLKIFTIVLSFGSKSFIFPTVKFVTFDLNIFGFTASVCF